jgi:ATP/maltotriose-dependent transcriptional regulator MalT
MLHAQVIDERADEVLELHRGASAWFEAHDDTSQAISHALAVMPRQVGQAADRR